MNQLANRRYTLEVEGKAARTVRSADELEAALGGIHPRTRSFFILSRADGCYVQVAGARLRLIIEYREMSAADSRHFVLGRREGDQTLTSINYSGGAIALQRCEIFALKQALEVFTEFFRTGAVPEPYRLREVTTDLRHS